MRKIINRPRAGHRPGAAAAFAVLGLLLTVVGCGRERTTGEAAGTAAASDPACPLRVDATGWQAFADLAGRITAGAAVDATELDALGELPAFTAWRESLAPNVPPALRVGNWVEEAFWTELGRTGDRKANADRRALSASFRWAWDRRARVDSLASRLAADEGACAVIALTDGWIAPDRLPDPVTVYVLPGKAELRWHAGQVFVDTGVLAAGRPAQLARQIAGLLYRNLQAEDGANPLEAAGDTAVAHTFRILRNEGVATWIEDLPHTHFDPGHPRLRLVRPVPEHFFATTLRTVQICSEVLPGLFADPDRMTARGEEFARTVAAGGGFSQAGYGMAAVIAGRLGEDRLKAAATSVPGFVAAYQEAALLNGDQRPLPGAAGHEPWESLAPLPPDVFARLLPLLERQFGPVAPLNPPSG